MNDCWTDCCDCLNPVTRRTFLLTLVAAVASACSGPTIVASMKREKELLDDASDLYGRVAVDLHSHPGPLAGGSAFSRRARDLPAALRDMREGGLAAALFSLPTDRPVIRREKPTSRNRQFREPQKGELFHYTQATLDKLLASQKAGVLAVALSAKDVITLKRQKIPSAILAFEGADCLEGQLSRIQFFYDRGVRTIQLVHYRINELGDIQTEPPKYGGLTPFGRDVVRQMNRLGMVIDTAHASTETLRGILAETRHPVIDSHSRQAARVKIRRARTDDELRAIARGGGGIGVWPLARKGETFENFLADIEYVQSVAGIDHLGIGTDLNGVRDLTVIPTHKEFALIPAGLLARGYAEADVAKIIGGNFVRVFSEIAG